MNGIYGSVGDTNLLEPNHDEWLSVEYKMHHVPYSFRYCIFDRIHHPKIDNKLEQRVLPSMFSGFASAFVFVFISFSCSIMAHNDRINWFFFGFDFFLSLAFFCCHCNSQHIFHCVSLFVFVTMLLYNLDSLSMYSNCSFGLNVKNYSLSINATIPLLILFHFVCLLDRISE